MCIKIHGLGMMLLLSCWPFRLSSAELKTLPPLVFSSTDFWLDECGMTQDLRSTVEMVNGHASFNICNATQNPLALRRVKGGENYLIKYDDLHGNHREIEHKSYTMEWHIERLEILNGQSKKGFIFVGADTTAEYKVELPPDCKKLTAAVLELSYVTLAELGECTRNGALENLLANRSFRVRAKIIDKAENNVSDKQWSNIDGNGKSRKFP